MSDVNWASLISKPQKVFDLENADLINYHGLVAQVYFNNSNMLPAGYRSAVTNLYLTINEELMRRMSA